MTELFHNQGQNKTIIEKEKASKNKNRLFHVNQLASAKRLEGSQVGNTITIWISNLGALWTAEFSPQQGTLRLQTILP